MSNIIGWTYEAGVHCWNCAVERFPALYDSETVYDREGNEVHPVFEWDETVWDCCEDCGECLGGFIGLDEPHDCGGAEGGCDVCIAL